MKVSIITPNEYVGNIMPLCQDRRGEYKNMQYLDTRLVEMHYEMPLNEIIYDFFDTLKARTKGYASLDYELSEYKPSDLVKVDMLLNGDQVDLRFPDGEIIHMTFRDGKLYLPDHGFEDEEDASGSYSYSSEAYENDEYPIYVFSKK